jgi:hypothetical protein
MRKLRKGYVGQVKRDAGHCSANCRACIPRGYSSTNGLKGRKSQGSQATVKQPLIDIDVVHQQLLKGAPKIG